MAPPFQQPSTDPLVYLALGALTVIVVIASGYIIYIHRKGVLDKETASEENGEEEELRTDNIGLSKKSEDLLNQILENPEMQNDIPDKLDVSKATVSNAVKELKERGLIIKKKKGNSYLLEPDRDELEKQQR